MRFVTRSDDPPPEVADAARDAMQQRLGVLCLSAFGLGLSPIVPGTIASLATAAVLYSMPRTFAFLAAVILCVAFGAWATLRFAAQIEDTDAPKQGDPGWVVSDEVAGQAVATLGTLPAYGDWRLALVAFVLFRLFDISKIGPVKRAEQMPGAVGVLLDDIVAGALAGLITLGVGLAGVLP